MKENVTPPLVAIERCFDAPRSTYKLSRLISMQFLKEQWREFGLRLKHSPLVINLVILMLLGEN